MITRKKILLISANRLSVPYPVYPIGLSYISAYLQEKLPGFDIELFDLNLKTSVELKSLLLNSRPDYIGVSFRNADDMNSESSTSLINEYQKLISLIRQNSGALIIIGGSAFSIFPEVFFTRLNPDFGISGEGEHSMYKLIDSLEQNKDYKQVEGLVYAENNRVKINPKSCINNDTLRLSYHDEMTDFYWEKSGTMNIQTKRGCPKRCIYCTYPLIEGNKTRTIEVGQIIEDLSFFYFKKHINYFFITDSVFNVDEEYNCQLAEKMISKGIKIKWGAYFTPQGLNRETLMLYKKAGLRHIEFGTESLSNVQLKNYGKSFSVDDVLISSELCNEAGIYFAHFLILCGYGETETTLDETFSNSARMKNSIIFPYIGMRIYPGTILHKLAIKEKKLSPEQDLLFPVYYVSDQVDIESINERAKKTGQKWVFESSDYSELLNKMRANHKKGPLWHLIR